MKKLQLLSTLFNWFYMLNMINCLIFIVDSNGIKCDVLGVDDEIIEIPVGESKNITSPICRECKCYMFGSTCCKYVVCVWVFFKTRQRVIHHISGQWEKLFKHICYVIKTTLTVLISLDKL